ASGGHEPGHEDAVAAGPGADAAQPGEHGPLRQSPDGRADAERAARPARPLAVGPHGGAAAAEPAARQDDEGVRRHHRPTAEAARRYVPPAATGRRPAGDRTRSEGGT